jgi:hypothetical protein
VGLKSEIVLKYFQNGINIWPEFDLYFYLMCLVPVEDPTRKCYWTDKLDYKNLLEFNVLSCWLRDGKKAMCAHPDQSELGPCPAWNNYDKAMFHKKPKNIP